MSESSPQPRPAVPMLRPQKTAILLAQRIVGEITDRKLKPGAPLPPEREMLQEFGVARGTLREALRFLEIQGVLTIRPGPGGGPTVNGVEPRSLASVIALLLQLSDAPFSTILEARQLLEPATAGMAAERVSRADLNALKASLVTMEQEISDLQAFLAENRNFHDIIAHASGNRLFELLLRSLSWITDASALGVDYDDKRRHGILSAHEKIYEAIASRDPAVAEEAMRVHMDEFARYINRHYSSVLKKPLRWDQTSI
jgi:GntR family transcriptional repressor for pyruvate dehydrogenase complex